MFTECSLNINRYLLYAWWIVVDALMGGGFACWRQQARRRFGIIISIINQVYEEHTDGFPSCRRGERERVREAFPGRRLRHLYSPTIYAVVCRYRYTQMVEPLVLPPPTWECMPSDVAAEVLQQLGQTNHRRPMNSNAAVRSTHKGWRAAHDQRVVRLKVSGRAPPAPSSILNDARFPGLKEIQVDASGDHYPSDVWITAMVSLAPLITSLTLKCCRQVTDERLGPLAPLTRLTYLHLGGCSQISDARLKVIINFKTMFYNKMK
jgi:hypothetical protein